MKKLLALLLALVFAFAFCGCGGDEPEKAVEKTTTKTAEQNQTVTCGDFTMEVSNDYEPFTSDEFDEKYMDMSAFEKETEEVTLTINYFDIASYKDAAGIAELMSSNFDNPESTEVEENFGTCYYVTGDYQGCHQALAFFDRDGKAYMIDMTSQDVVLTLDDVQAIIKTVKEK